MSTHAPFSARKAAELMSTLAEFRQAEQALAAEERHLQLARLCGALLMAEEVFEARPDFAAAEIRGDHEGSFMFDVMLRAPCGALARADDVALALQRARELEAAAPGDPELDLYGRDDELAARFSGFPDLDTDATRDDGWRLRDAFAYAQEFAPRFFWDHLEGKTHLRGDAPAIARAAGVDEAASLIEAARLLAGSTAGARAPSPPRL